MRSIILSIFRGVGVIIVIVSLVLVLIFALLGFSIFGGAYSLVQESNKKVIQKIELVNNEVNIRVPLHEKLGIQYTYIKTCSEKEKDDIFFNRVVLENGSSLSSDVACFNEMCTLSIDLGDLKEIPKELYVFVKNDENICHKTKYTTQGHVLPLQYISTVEFTEELKEMLSIVPDDKYEVSSNKSSGTLVYQVMGTKKAVFSYNKKITDDTLLVNSAKKATIVFDFIPDEKYNILRKR